MKVVVVRGRSSRRRVVKQTRPGTKEGLAEKPFPPQREWADLIWMEQLQSQGPELAVSALRSLPLCWASKLPLKFTAS